VLHNIPRRYGFATFLQDPLCRGVLRMPSMSISLLVQVATSQAFFAVLAGYSGLCLQDSALQSRHRNDWKLAAVDSIVAICDLAVQVYLEKARSLDECENGAEGVSFPVVWSGGFEHSIRPAVWLSARSSASPAQRHRVLSQAELSRNSKVLPRHTWDGTVGLSGFN
jgi:hypothetical protein